MKKVFAIAFAAAMGLCLFGTRADATVQPAPVNQVYGAFCCDGAGVHRCEIVNPTPVGNGCFCPGQGYGFVCL
jgi:hypothetical protein